MKAELTTNKSTLRSTIAYLNSNGVTEHTHTPKEERWMYNCWGFTQGILDNREEFEWVGANDMETWLKKNTVIVTRPKCGDIVVFRGVDEEDCCCDMYDEEGAEFSCTCKLELLHTALLVDPEKMIIIHKPGGSRLERCTVDWVLQEAPHYGEVTEFRRVKK